MPRRRTQAYAGSTPSSWLLISTRKGGVDEVPERGESASRNAPVEASKVCSVQSYIQVPLTRVAAVILAGKVSPYNNSKPPSKPTSPLTLLLPPPVDAYPNSFM